MNGSTGPTVPTVYLSQEIAFMLASSLPVEWATNCFVYSFIALLLFAQFMAIAKESHLLWTHACLALNCHLHLLAE